MKALQTASGAHVTERQKAFGRLGLLTVVGLVCPPLAAARSGAVWGVYLLLVVLYSLWTVRATSSVSRDGQLGYLLCVADAAVLVPILVWSIDVSMPILLSLLWAAGVMTSWRAARSRPSFGAAGRDEYSTPGSKRSREKDRDNKSPRELTPLERALQVRLGIHHSEGTRFALIILRLTGHEPMIIDCGKEATKSFLEAAGGRALRLLGADAQLFALSGGRMAFVFAMDAEERTERKDAKNMYDVESSAMALAERVCEQTLMGHRLECHVGWASAPADGTTAADLLWVAKKGASSSAAFRHVGHPAVRVIEPEQKRAVAG